jgi:hypothetical protein
MYIISQLAKAHDTKVVLTGDGADELFCGYQRWPARVRMMPWYRVYLRTPLLIREAAERAYRLFDESSPRYELLRQAAAGHEVYCGIGRLKGSAQSRALSPVYLQRITNHDPSRTLTNRVAGYRNAFPNPLLAQNSVGRSATVLC